MVTHEIQITQQVSVSLLARIRRDNKGGPLDTGPIDVGAASSGVASCRFVRPKLERDESEQCRSY
jgi:hypothetical protein